MFGKIFLIQYTVCILVGTGDFRKQVLNANLVNLIVAIEQGKMGDLITNCVLKSFCKNEISNKI